MPCYFPELLLSLRKAQRTFNLENMGFAVLKGKYVNLCNDTVLTGDNNICLHRIISLAYALRELPEV